MSSEQVRNQNQSGIRIKIDQSRLRQTQDTSFGKVFQTGLTRTTDALLRASQLAAPFVPGGAVVSAAITGLGQVKSSVSGQSASGASNATGITMTGTTGGSAPLGTGGLGGSTGLGVGSTGGSVAGTGAFANITNQAAAGDNSAQLLVATREMQELNQTFNLQYLMLQQKMQSENREFTTLSNVMKTRHDSAKNAISNVR